MTNLTIKIQRIVNAKGRYLLEYQWDGLTDKDECNIFQLYNSLVIPEILGHKTTRTPIYRKYSDICFSLASNEDYFWRELSLSNWHIQYNIDQLGIISPLEILRAKLEEYYSGETETFELVLIGEPKVTEFPF